MLASRTNLPASGVSLNDYEESAVDVRSMILSTRRSSSASAEPASDVVTGNMPYMASVPVKGKGKGKTLIMQSSRLPYLPDILPPAALTVLSAHLRNHEDRSGTRLDAVLFFAHPFDSRIRPHMFALFGITSPDDENVCYIDIPGFRPEEPYFIRNEGLEDEHLPMEVDSTGVDPPNNGASANSPYIAPNPNDAPDVSDDPVTTDYDPWTVSQEAFLAAQPDDSARWRDAVIYNVRAHVPDGPVDELLNFTDPEPSIPVDLENDLCSRIYRECCLLYHSLPMERKVRWRRPRIRASDHTALIRAYQELRTALINDGGVLPPDGDSLRADPPMDIMGWG